MSNSHMTYKAYMVADEYQDDGWSITWVRVDGDNYDWMVNAVEEERAILVDTVDIVKPSPKTICKLGGKAAELMREKAAARYKESMGTIAEFESKFLLLGNDS